MRQLVYQLILIIVFSLLSCTTLFPQIIAKVTDKSSLFRTNGDSEKPTVTLMNINRFSYWVRNDGWSGRNPHTAEAGGIYPAGTGPVVFQDGVVWGGWVDDPDSLFALRVGGQTFWVGTVPGRIISPGIPEDPDLPHVRIYRIRKDYQTLSEHELRQDAAQLFYDGDTTLVTPQDIQKVQTQYEKDWNEWPVEYGAPFYDLNRNGIYEPQQGETPGLANADQVVWFVCNDLDEDATTNAFGSPPLGLELQVTLWAYKGENDFLGDVIFKRYRLINKSEGSIDSMYIGQWADMDIGNYTQDLVGCDTLLQIGYAYNGLPDDGDFTKYQLTPPAAGYVLLQGPIIPSPGDTALFDFNRISGFKNLKMNAFSYLFFLGEPPPFATYEKTLQYYNSLRGYRPTNDIENPDPYIIGYGPHAGEPTRFPLSGDPVTGIGDIDGRGNNLSPRDVRLMVSSGPFTMQPGDTQEVVFALVGGKGTISYLSNIDVLRINSRAIREEFPNFYRTYHTMVAPVVEATSFDGKVVLDWGKDAELLQEIEREDLPGNYFFEGYNIYQLPRWDASPEEAVYITTIDRETPPRIISGYRLDPLSGTFRFGPLLYGNDSGLQYFCEIDQDYISRSSFQNYQTYYFAVRGYRFTPDPAYPFPVIESPSGKVAVRVYENNPGYQASLGDEISVSHVAGRGSGEIIAKVVNPASVTGHTYEITFDSQQRWSLMDINTGTIKLSQQTNLSGGNHFPTVDGIMVSIWSPDSLYIRDWTYEGDRWISGYNWGGSHFFGGLDVGWHFLGSTIANEELVPVQLVFQDSQEVNEDGFWSKGAVYRRDLGYTYAGTGELPIRAFDVTLPDAPRRLNISFTEDDTLAPANFLWDMGWDGNRFPDEMGAGEQLFIHLSDYDEGQRYGAGTPFSGDTLWAPGSDVLFALWPKSRGVRPYLHAHFTMDIHLYRPFSSEDIFQFTAPPPPDIPTRVQLFQNYPNPFNNGTIIRYRIPTRGRVLLEVFNILGERVAVIEDAQKNEGQYEIRWEPRTLSSGIYFIHLEAAGIHETRKIAYVR